MKIEKAIDRLKYLADENLHIDDIKALEIAISALEEKLNGGWIPVKERYPEEPIYDKKTESSREVLIQDEHGFMYVSRYWGYYGKTYGGNGWLDIADYRVIVAWQELPEPYREVENE